MTITLNGTTGITSTGAYSSDGISFADNTPANTLVTDTSGNVGIGTSSPTVKLDVAGRALFTNNGFNYVAVDSTASDSYFRLASNTAVKWYIRNNVSNSHRLEITPDAGTSTGMFLTQAGDFQMNSGYGSVATAYGCRAWVNFNGTGTVAIRASGNVSSVSDDGTGTYTINFTNAMPDANYNVISNGPPNSTTVVGGLGFVVRNSSPSGSPSNKTTTQVQMMYAGTGSLVDASELYASVFR